MYVIYNIKINKKNGLVPTNLYVSNTEGWEELLDDEGFKKVKETSGRKKE
jgi:hypothetical protein